ncbi:hypothetical protein [Jeotgalibacillus salarius]|uniref:DUF3953 domain-containing protein n=1 Tax=Jeotgalibacillus salarius TaxID=546023 RepID=A0A4Y8LG79_9BACL|nr:hypothetical protein [Jeotgalibacillus salarius]TFE00587.1 hypothetical protein E2626_11465 [Jeotgalibacillus salarius]
MKILKFTLIAIGMFLCAYGMITDQVSVTAPYILLTVGVAFVINGMNEFKNRNTYALTLFFSAGFVLVVGVYILLSS